MAKLTMTYEWDVPADVLVDVLDHACRAGVLMDWIVTVNAVGRDDNNRVEWVQFDDIDGINRVLAASTVLDGLKVWAQGNEHQRETVRRIVTGWPVDVIDKGRIVQAGVFGDEPLRLGDEATSLRGDAR